MSKVCISCGCTKPIGLYYKHPNMADGHVNVCKDCHKERMRQRNKTAAVQEYDRNRYHNDPKRRVYSNAKAKEHREIYPERYKARTAVSNAIRDGRLKRGPCHVCGTTAGVEAHHPDYAKPLDVVWVCKPHHEAL